MIRWGPEIGVEDWLAGRGAWRLPSPFQRDEDGVDFRQHLRVAEFYDPATLSTIIVVEDAQAADGAMVRAGVATPGVIGELAFVVLRCREIERIEDQGLPLRVKRAAERLLGFAAAVNVEYVHNVNIT